MSKPANLLLAVLRERLKGERDKLERQALRRRIDALAHKLARDEYRAKAAPVLRETWGAY